MNLVRIATWSAHGVRVIDARQLDDAIAQALAHDGPSLVEVMTDADLV